MNRNHDETSTALLNAAHHLLSSVGPEALTVRRIANEADMSTMNVYSRFGGKDGVIDELYADGYRRLIAQLGAVPIGDDTTANITNLCNSYREFALENSTYYGIMFRSTIPGFEPSADSIEVAVGLLTGMIERVGIAQDSDKIGTDMDSGEVAAYLWATCHGLVSLELDGVASEFLSWETIWNKSIVMAVATVNAGADINA